jgi:glycerol-3-phosphate O-acyltransferase
MIEASLLEAVDADLRRPRRSDHSFMQLIRLAQIVQPILERYYMTFILLWQTASAPLDEKQLEYRCHLLAQKVSMIHGINSPDFFDRLLFRDFIAIMLDLDYLRRDAGHKLEFAPEFDYLRLDLRNLLSTEVRSSIQSIAKPGPG